MATITLTADTDYSALTVANDDTIDCAGFVLTLDEQPTETGIQVTTPGTAGTVVFSDAWVIPTWDFYAGTGPAGGMITTLPSGAEIGSITGGTATNSRGVGTNNGTVVTANGGTAGSCFGVSTNHGTITTANGGSGSTAQGVNINSASGVVTTANGGTAASVMGVATNNGTVVTANGGTAGNANGVNANVGTVITANGSATHAADGVLTNNSVVITANGGGVANAWGVATNNAYVLRLTDDVSRGVETFATSLIFVEGPFIDGEIVGSRLETIYTLGALSGTAVTPVGVDVIEVSKGKGLTGIR